MQAVMRDVQWMSSNVIALQAKTVIAKKGFPLQAVMRGTK
jgi:hypothetical protein